jgi:putative transposase
VNLLERHRNGLLVREIEQLRETVRLVGIRNPFYINDWVVLPDHLHSVWTLPPEDADFGTRWRLIKSGVSPALPRTQRPFDGRKTARCGRAALGNGIPGNT